MEEELLNNQPSNADLIKKAVTNQSVRDREQTGLDSSQIYSENRRDVGKDFEDFNKFDKNVTLGINQNNNRAENQDYKAGRALLRLPRNIVGEVLTTAGGLTQLATNPTDTFSGEMGNEEINPFAEWLISAGKEVSQGDSFRAIDLYTKDSGVLDPSDSNWWAKTIEGWGPTVGMMVGSMGVGAVTKGITSGISRGVAGKIAAATSKAQARSIAKQEALTLSKKYITDNLSKATTAKARKAVYDTAKGIKKRAEKELLDSSKGLVQKTRQEAMERASQLPSIKQTEGWVNTVATSMVSRNAETFGESKQTYDLVLARSKEQHPERTEEEHKLEASSAAAKNYQRGMMLALIDMYQYSKILKGFDKGAKELNKGFLNKLGTYVKQGVSEGGEETLQYSISKEAQEANQIFGDETVASTFFKSMRDKEFQESFVQGAIGGIAFQGMGDVLSLTSKALSKKDKDAKESSDKIDKELSDNPTPAKKKEEGSTADPLDETDVPEPSGENEVDIPDPTDEPTINFTDIDPLDEDAPNTYSDEDPVYDDETRPDAIDPIDEPPAYVSEPMPEDDFGPEPFTEEDEFGPLEDTPKGVDGEQLAASKSVANNPDIQKSLNDGLGTNFNDNIRNNIEEQIKLERKQIQEEIDVMRTSLKTSHGKLAPLAEAVINKNAINRNTDLTRSQKNELIAPHQKTINEHKEKGESLNSKQIKGYRDLSKTADKDVANTTQDINVNKVTDAEGVTLESLKDNQLVNQAAREDLSSLAKDELALELESRKQTPEIQRALQQLNQEPISQETAEELGLDSEDEIINKALTNVVNKIGNQINVVEGPLGYNYETNTLSRQKGDTQLDKVLAIAKELAKQNDPSVKKIEAMLRKYNINIPFYQVIDQIFTDSQFAVHLMNIPINRKETILDVIFKSLRKLLGIKDPNLFEETVVEFYNAIKSNNKKPVEINTHPAIPEGQVTDIVTSYRMATYYFSDSVDKIYNSTGAKAIGYPVTKQGRQSYVEIKGKRYYLDPGYKTQQNDDSKRTTFLYEKKGQDFFPVTNDLYTKEEQENMKKDIPFKAELEVRIIKDNNDPMTATIGLFHKGNKVGILSGWFPEKPNKKLAKLRNDIYNRKNQSEIGTVTFEGSNDAILRTPNERSHMEVIPSDQMSTYEIGVITEVNKELADRTEYNIGDALIQFDIDTFEPYNGNQPAGHPVLYIKNPRGVRVPIQGSSVIFGSNEDAQKELFDIINNTPDNKLEGAIRSMVRWSVPMDGYKKVHPVVDKDWKSRNTKPLIKTEDVKLEGTYLTVDSSELGLDPIQITKEEGNNLTLSNGQVITLQQAQQQYKVHPYTTFMNEQNIWGKGIQMDRNKLSDKSYLESRKDYMKFQVAPGVFGVPVRKVSMKLNAPNQPQKVKAEPSIIPVDNMFNQNEPVAPIEDADVLNTVNAATVSLFGLTPVETVTEVKKTKNDFGLSNLDITEDRFINLSRRGLVPFITMDNLKPGKKYIRVTYDKAEILEFVKKGFRLGVSNGSSNPQLSSPFFIVDGKERQLMSATGVITTKFHEVDISSSDILNQAKTQKNTFASEFGEAKKAEKNGFFIALDDQLNDVKIFLNRPITKQENQTQYFQDLYNKQIKNTKSSLETAGFNSNDKTDWLNNDTGLTPKEKREKRKKEREAQKEADNNCKKS
jgi:hypothetical protein